MQLKVPCSGLEHDAKQSGGGYSELCAGPIHAEGEGKVLLFSALQSWMFFLLQKVAPCFEPLAEQSSSFCRQLMCDSPAVGSRSGSDGMQLQSNGKKPFFS